MSVALYWFCAVMFGPLITLTWYHLRARRVGAVPQTGWHLLYASASLALYVALLVIDIWLMRRYAGIDPDQDTHETPGPAAPKDKLTTAMGY